MKLNLQFRQATLKRFEAPRDHSIIKVPNVEAGSVLVLQIGDDPLNTQRKEEGAMGITLLYTIRGEDKAGIRKEETLIAQAPVGPPTHFWKVAPYIVKDFLTGQCIKCI